MKKQWGQVVVNSGFLSNNLEENVFFLRGRGASMMCRNHEKRWTITIYEENLEFSTDGEWVKIKGVSVYTFLNDQILKVVQITEEEEQIYSAIQKLSSREIDALKFPKHMRTSWDYRKHLGIIPDFSVNEYLSWGEHVRENKESIEKLFLQEEVVS